MPALEAILSKRHAKLRRCGEWRAPVTAEPCSGAEIIRNGRRLISFASNDYLGLARHPDVIRAAHGAAEKYGAGAGASRLAGGNYSLLDTLEEKLALFKGTEAACVFGSGMLANLGAVPALMERGDLILADKLVHASLLDGCRLSRATIRRFRHNEDSHARNILGADRKKYRHCLIVADGVYSMDGDRAPLSELAELAKTHDAWLMVDDAHGLGVLGKGKGTAHESSPIPYIDVHMGTLSKSLGSYGGYIAGNRTLIETLHNSARALIFSTALPPPAAAAALASLGIMDREPERIARPLELARRFTEYAKLPEAQSAIVPLVLGSSERALAASAALEEGGFFVPAIRPPSVPRGSARLRLAFTAAHSDAQLNALVAALRGKGVLPCAA